MKLTLDSAPAIVIDSRERVYAYQFNHPTVIAKLDTGDYSLVGYENQIIIERKSLNDLVGSLPRLRFWDECARLQCIPFRCILVESSPGAIWAHQYHSPTPPWYVFADLNRIRTSYQVEIIWGQDRRTAPGMLRAILLDFLAKSEVPV